MWDLHLLQSTLIKKIIFYFYPLNQTHPKFPIQTTYQVISWLNCKLKLVSLGIRCHLDRGTNICELYRWRKFSMIFILASVILFRIRLDLDYYTYHAISGNNSKSCINPNIQFFQFPAHINIAKYWDKCNR